jgi:Family of unknown function (DUF6504)
MRRYDEVIDVRRGLVSGEEAPTQFLWRDRLWVVRDIIAHWVETGAWWEQPGVGVLFGGADPSGQTTFEQTTKSGPARCADLLGEKEIWRVEAIRARASAGVFDVSFDWALGQWRLVCCID